MTDHEIRATIGADGVGHITSIPDTPAQARARAVERSREHARSRVVGVELDISRDELQAANWREHVQNERLRHARELEARRKARARGKDGRARA
jgi:hypothetical protein